MERVREPGSRRHDGRDDSSAGARRATLTIAAAPIGRPEDASPRLASALGEAQIVAAEDTRRLRRLASALGVQVTARVVSYYDSVEAARTPGLLADLEAGRDVLLITDAGLPGVSDPGFRLVAAAATAGIRVTVLPGPSAVTAALAVSGLPTDRFCFEGFPSRKAGERARRFAELAGEPRTLIFFESPRRLAATLTGLAEAFGAGRRAVVCRELTKTHEEIIRGSLTDLADRARAGLLGEVTIVVEGARHVRSRVTPEEAAAQVRAREQAGESRKTAIAAVAGEHGLPRRAVYDAVVRGPAGEGG